MRDSIDPRYEQSARRRTTVDDEFQARQTVERATKIANPNRRLNPKIVDTDRVRRALVVSGD